MVVELVTYIEFHRSSPSESQPSNRYSTVKVTEDAVRAFVKRVEGHNPPELHARHVWDYVCEYTPGTKAVHAIIYAPSIA